MSNLNKKILLFFMVVAVAFGLVGCTNPDNSVRIRFNVEEIEVRLNETKLLEPTIIKSSQVESVDLIFSSSDESIVKVEDGVLVPVAMGEAVVKVAWEDRDIIFDKVVVKVIKATLPRPTIAYDLAMLKGATQTVSVNLGSLNLTEATYSFVALTPEIATISEEGVITAVAVGTAKFEIVVSDYEEEERYPISVTVAESDFAIKYELNGGTNHAENPVGYSALKLPLPLKDATKVGYEFLGWYENGNKVTEIAAGRLGDVELEAEWKAEEYTISYEGVEGATFEAGYELPKAYTIESEEIVLGAPAKVGYKFLGWYVGEQKVEKIAKGSTGDVELEAKWEAVEYSISYDFDGGQSTSGYVYDKADAQTEFTLVYFNTYDVMGTTITPALYDTKLSGQAQGKYPLYWRYIALEATEEAGLYKVVDMATSRNNLSKEVPEYDAVIVWYVSGSFTMSAELDAIIKDKASYMGDYILLENIPSEKTKEANISGYALNPEDCVYVNNDVNKYTIEDEVALSVPTKEGYEFLGWYDANGNKVEKVAKGSTGDVALKAKWEIEEYEISYDLDGGEFAYAPATTLAEFEAAFWPAFAAWHKYTGSIEDFKTAVMANWGNYKLYALNGKDVVNEDYFINASTTPQVWKNWFYTLVEQWLTINSGQNLWASHYTGHLRVKEFFSGETSANWKATHRAIIYATYYETEVESYTIEDEVSLLKANKEGYKFAGWYVGEQLVEKVAKGSTGDLALKAKWETVEYTISYELDGGVNAEGNPAKYTIESENITLAAPTKEGYIFVEWVEGDKIEKGSTGNKTFTAKWEKIPVYTISWDLNGGSLAEGETLVESYRHGTPVALPTPTRYSHTFLGWYEGETKVTEIAGKNYELVAKWENVTIKSDNLIVVYELDGGNWQEGQVPDAEHPFAEMVGYVPAKEGYSFVKWDVVADNTSTPSVTTLTAVWEVAAVYNITYDLAGGVAPEGNPATYTEFTATFALLPATKEGYTFAGWYNGDQKVESIELGSKGDLALVAKWTATEYEINYNLDGGVNAEGNPATYTVESEEIVLAAPTKEGYKFLGWEDAEGNKVEKIAAGSKGNVELTATWQSLEGKISYDLAGGTLVSAPNSLEELAVYFWEAYAAWYGGSVEEVKDAALAEWSSSKQDTYKIYPAGGKGTENAEYFITDPATDEAWRVWFDAFDAGVTAANSTQSAWGSTWTGLLRLSAVLKGTPPSTFTEEIKKSIYTAYMPEGAVKLPTSYVAGTPVELPTPSKEGAVFGGWLLDGKPFKFTAETAGDLHLVASWKTPVVAEDMAVTDADATALNALGVVPAIVVNPAATEGTYKLVNANLDGEYAYHAYELGVNLFTSIAAALEKAEANAVIYVMAGTYAEELVISVENLTLVGPNYNVHGKETRAEEANVTAVTYVYGDGLTVNGLKFSENGAISVSADDVTLSHLVVNANQIGAVGTNRKSSIVSGYVSLEAKAEEEAAGTAVNASKKYASIANFAIVNSFIDAPTRDWNYCYYLNGAMALNTVNGLTLSGNYITNSGATTVENSSSWEGMIMYNVSGEMNIVDNDFMWATDGYLMVIGYNSNTATINIKDNVFDGNENVKHTATIHFRTPTGKINVEHNEFHNFKGTTFSFRGTYTAEVKVLYNYFDANTAYKTANTAIVYENNYYEAAQSTTTSDYGTITSLEALETAYAVYKAE